MRYLNKIILINSASVKYAEVNVDGNVHFIGTQGVGKSTLLRALLFFYNANQQRLGIPVGKKSFVEFYFPFQDSYIIYEVVAKPVRIVFWLLNHREEFVSGSSIPPMTNNILLMKMAAHLSRGKNKKPRSEKKSVTQKK